jgi:hypothetical protein
MSNGYSTEVLEEILESLEDDESDEMDELAERSRRGRRASHRASPRTATGKGLVPQKPSSAYVTETRLQAALAQVGKQIKTNSDAIATVNTRINKLSDNIAAQTAALKKEAEERKKDINSLKSNVQLASLLPLLIKPASKTLTGDAAGLKAGDKVLVESGDTLSALLPLFLLGGMGSSADGSASGAAGGSMDQMTMLMLVLAVSGGLGGSSK